MNYIKIIFIYIIFPVVALGMVSCGKTDEPKPIATPVHRTVLVYMVANNNLGSRNLDVKDIEEMQQSAANGGLNGGRLIVFHAPNNGSPALKEVLADGTIRVLKEYPSGTCAVASSTMSTVIADCKHFAPANEYGLVLWSHANGWLMDGIADDLPAASTKSFGQDAGKKMNTTTLAATLQGESFKFIYFDCCYMGAIEVAYELRQCTDYIVSSPTETPLEGMPYHLNVGCFFSQPTADLVNAAKNTFNDYNSRTDYNRSCTIAVLRTAAIDKLAQATRNIYKTVDWSALPASYSPQKYMYENRCYHFDFDDYISHLTSDAALIDTWRSALAEVVVFEDATPEMWPGLNSLNFRIKTHCGLSTFVIRSDSDFSLKGYNQTSWYADVARFLEK